MWVLRVGIETRSHSGWRGTTERETVVWSIREKRGVGSKIRHTKMDDYDQYHLPKPPFLRHDSCDSLWGYYQVCPGTTTTTGTTGADDEWSTPPRFHGRGPRPLGEDLGTRGSSETLNPHLSGFGHCLPTRRVPVLGARGGSPLSPRLLPLEELTVVT